MSKKDKLVYSMFCLISLIYVSMGSLLGTLIVRYWIEYAILTKLTYIFIILMFVVVFILIFFIEKENRKEAETKI